MMKDGFEDLVDHAEMVFARVELLFEIDEVGGYRIESKRQEASDVEIDLRIILEEGLGVFDEEERRWLEGSDGGHVGATEKDGDLSENGAGRRDDVYLSVLFEDFDRAFFENEERRALVVLHKNFFTFLKFTFGEAVAEFKSAFHRGRVLASGIMHILYRMGEGTKRIFRGKKLRARGLEQGTWFG